MALTPFRWIALAVTGMLVACVITVGGLRYFDRRYNYVPTAEQRSIDSMWASTSLHERRASLFARQYRMAQLAESLRAVTARDSRTGAVRVSYGASVPPILRTTIDSTVAGGSEKIGASPRIGVDLVVLRDTTSISGIAPWPYGETPFYILPSRTGDRCLVVIAIGREFYAHSSVRTLSTDDAKQQIFGPCAFYAAFGMPGPRVRDWLRARGGLFALGGYWTRTAAPPGDPIETYDPYYTKDPYYPIGPASFTYYSPRAINCVTGNIAACEESMLMVNAGYAPLTAGPALRLGYRLGPISRRDGAEFGGRETELLADMTRSLGRERFERFWTSNDSVRVAFQRAAGMPLGEWVQGWASERLDPIKHGPTMRAGTLISGLGIAGACLLIGVFAARRREFA